MKKITIVLFCLLFSGILFASSVWEGVAGIASSRDFPDSGLYVLSNAFPKNTLVEIYNLENGIKLNATVVGTIETNGVLATVSPDVAKELGLRSGSVSRVRITIPQKYVDSARIVSETTPILDPDTNPEAAIAFDKNRYGSNSGTTISSVPAENTNSEYEIIDIPTELPAYTVEETPVVEDVVIADETAVIEDVVIADETPVVENVVIADETPVVEDVVIADETPVVEDGLTPIEEETYSDLADVNPVETNEPIEEIVVLDESLSPKDDLITDTLADPELALEESENIETLDSLTAPEDVVMVDTIEDEPELVFVEENKVSDIIVEVPDVEEIVLVDDTSKEIEVNYSIPTEGIYVQVASYKDNVSTQDFKKRFGDKYPVVLQSVPEKNFTKVLIGPVTKDEYGAVLERFKSFGYKDAFVSKKIK